MPIIANAKKALRQTKTRTERNRIVRAKVRNVVKSVQKQPEAGGLNVLFSTLDKAVKRGVIQKNKAARLKSAATKTVARIGQTTSVVKTAKKTSKKAAK